MRTEIRGQYEKRTIYFKGTEDRKEEKTGETQEAKKRNKKEN